MLFFITISYFGGAMSSLAVTAKGQVTLKRDLLTHLGIKPGQRVNIEKRPNGELQIRAERADGNIDAFIGLLAGKSKKIATLEEINEAAASGWANQQ
jgi:antitoxin PrlF